MYAIEKDVLVVNGENVETFKRKAVDGNTEIYVEAGTTGYKGGCCRKAGGRSVIRLYCACGDFLFRPIEDKEGDTIGITIAFCGDDGLNALMKALQFTCQVMNDQRCEVDD